MVEMKKMIEEKTYGEKKAFNEALDIVSEWLYRLGKEDDSFNIENFWEEIRDARE